MIRQPGPQPKPPAWARTYDMGQLLDKAVQMDRLNFVLFARYQSFKGVLAGHLAAVFTLASRGA